MMFSGISNPNYRHGMRNTKIYAIWANIKARCSNPNRPDYKYYGGRGIKLCNEWKDFTNFYEDMFPNYQEGFEIDRINNNGNYTKENCRWVKKSINCQNRNKQPNTSSKYVGVSWNKSNKGWQAVIKKDKITYYLGLFDTETEAATAYNNKAIQLYGTGAKINEL